MKFPAVEETDNLPKRLCCKSYDNLLRTNKTMEIFSATSRNTQKVLEAQLQKKRARPGSVATPVSSEKPRKQVCTLKTTATTARKSLMFQPEPVGMGLSFVVVEGKEVGRILILYCLSNKYIVIQLQ